MISYPLPKFEQQRTEVLQRYRILNSMEHYDARQTARTASLVFGTPIVLAALNSRYREWYHCAHGVDQDGFEELRPFSNHANLADEAFSVSDARRDPHFSNDPAVIGSAGVVFFAGAPLRDPDGKRFGSFCLIDSEPHQFKPEDLSILESFATLGQ